MLRVLGCMHCDVRAEVLFRCLTFKIILQSLHVPQASALTSALGSGGRKMLEA